MSDNQSNDAEAWEPIPEVFRLVEARAAIAQQPAPLLDAFAVRNACARGYNRCGFDSVAQRCVADGCGGAAIAQPAEPLIRGLSGKCSRSVCECERDRLGNQCIWLEPTDAELERRTGEPHVDGYPLYGGLPPAGAALAAQPATVKALTHAQAESSGLPRAIQWGALYSAACGVTAKLGKDGSIQADDAAVDSLMNALHALDGGQWMPGLMPAPTIQPVGERAE